LSASGWSALQRLYFLEFPSFNFRVLRSISSLLSTSFLSPSFLQLLCFTFLPSPSILPPFLLFWVLPVFLPSAVAATATGEERPRSSFSESMKEGLKRARKKEKKKKKKKKNKLITDVVAPAAKVAFTRKQKMVLTTLYCLVGLSIVITACEPLLACEHGGSILQGTGAGRLSTYLGSFGLLLIPVGLALGWMRALSVMQSKFPELVFEVGVYFLLKILSLTMATFFRLRHWCACDTRSGHWCNSRHGRNEGDIVLALDVGAFSFLQIYLAVGGCTCLSILVNHSILSKKMEISSNLLFTSKRHRTQARQLQRAVLVEMTLVFGLMVLSPFGFAFLTIGNVFFYVVLSLLLFIWIVDVVVCISASALFILPILSMINRVDDNDSGHRKGIWGINTGKLQAHRLLSQIRSTLAPRKQLVHQKARKLLGVEESAPILPEEMVHQKVPVVAPPLLDTTTASSETLSIPRLVGAEVSFLPSCLPACLPAFR
jgi:hypothetical protein